MGSEGNMRHHAAHTWMDGEQRADSRVGVRAANCFREGEAAMKRVTVSTASF